MNHKLHLLKKRQRASVKLSSFNTLKSRQQVRGRSALHTTFDGFQTNMFEYVTLHSI